MTRHFLKFLIFGTLFQLFISSFALASGDFYTSRERGEWLSGRLTLRNLSSFENWGRAISPGDVVLIPLSCMSCYYIEAETGAPFSHSAVVVGKRGGKIIVAEALGKLHTLSLKTFLSRARKGIPWVVMRPEFRTSFREISLNAKRRLLQTRFRQNFSHLHFDREYRWNDRDQNGNERLYCSEFVVKLLAPYLEYPLHPNPMTFSRYPDFWRQHYGGQAPSLEPGISPADLYKARGFEVFKWMYVEKP